MPKLSYRRPHLFSVLLILAVLIGGCASASPQEARTNPSAPEAESPAMEEAGRDDAGFGEIGTGGSVPQGLPEQRLVIRNASLSLIVDDPAASMDRISELAEEMDGFVVTANLRQVQLQGGIEAPRASITIRVPAERLNEAITRIESESNRDPEQENIESQDVTRDYTDLESRLRNLENTEAQLTEIMEDATRTEDVLSVYNRLVEIREQIEVIKGQMQYYEQSAALSAIQVELLPNEAVQPLRIGAWEPVGVAKEAVQSLLNAVQFLGEALIWILIFVVPVLLLLFVIFVLPLLLLARSLKRRRIARQVAPPAEPQA